jgi:hypothetical protein
MALTLSQENKVGTVYYRYLSQDVADLSIGSIQVRVLQVRARTIR